MGLYHIETSSLTCRANQRTGFYMIGTSIMKELISNFSEYMTVFIHIGSNCLLSNQHLFSTAKFQFPWHIPVYRDISSNFPRNFELKNFIAEIPEILKNSILLENFLSKWLTKWHFFVTLNATWETINYWTCLSINELPLSLLQLHCCCK